jgi:ACS family hexuronate transporter-like MFS transporter
MWSAVLLIGLAAAAHQGFSANLYTLVSDTVPRKAVSSVTGIGGMAGAVSGMLIAKLVGWVLDATGKNYFIPFLLAGFAYLVALAVIHLLLPRLQPMEIEPCG